jgi:hypothetical protein
MYVCCQYEAKMLRIVEKIIILNHVLGIYQIHGDVCVRNNIIFFRKYFCTQLSIHLAPDRNEAKNTLETKKAGKFWNFASENSLGL